MRSRRSEGNEEQCIVRVRILRSSTCVDVINQLLGAGGACNMNNWKLGCDYCNSKMQDVTIRKKRTETNDYR